MSLSSALSIAQSALLSTSKQTSVVSRNVSEAQNANYSRRQAVVSSTAPGARVVTIQRSASEQLLRQYVSALSSSTAQTTLLAGVGSLTTSVNGVDNTSSPATLMGKLQDALQLYSATPSSEILAESVVEAARQLVSALNNGSKAIQTFRAETDAQLGEAVDKLNSLLADFHNANRQVISDMQAGRDVSDALDRREAFLKQIAEFVPVTTMTRENGDMVLMTGDGTMLYETSPRTISFDRTIVYTAGTDGKAVYIDGIPLAAGNGGNTSASGKISALLQLRDDVAPAMQSQLDEIARGLITVFEETEPSGANAAPGLFTWSPPPAALTAGTLEKGLAAGIRINPAVEADPTLLRDGGINGAAYVWNASGGASYTALLNSYGDRLSDPIAFDASVGIGSSTTVANYASNAVGWVEALRQTASYAAETKEALLTRTGETLSNETGVNIDHEMTLLLDLEHSYQASARLLQAVDEMLASLLAAVR